MLRAVDDEAALRERVTAICLALPEVTVDESHHPHRGFKVAGKNLGWFTVNEHGSGRIALVVRAEAKENEALVASDPRALRAPQVRGSPRLRQLLPRPAEAPRRLGRGHRAGPRQLPPAGAEAPRPPPRRWLIGTSRSATAAPTPTSPSCRRGTERVQLRDHRLSRRTHPLLLPARRRRAHRGHRWVHVGRVCTDRPALGGRATARSGARTGPVGGR